MSLTKLIGKATKAKQHIACKVNGHFFIGPAPMIGTFYRKPSPDKDPFVNVGDEVSNAPLGERKTLERIEHMLKKGKPLRN